MMIINWCQYAPEGGRSPLAGIGHCTARWGAALRCIALPGVARINFQQQLPHLANQRKNRFGN